jgi:AcrR family transcriptional regulator
MRERLKAAVFELCAERGYVALDVETVTQRAGVELADWTRLYGDLEGCACEMLDEIRDEFVREVATAALQQDSWRDQMRAAAYAMLRWFLADIPRAHFVMIESWSIGERAVLIREEGMDAMISLIDIGRSELEDPESLTRATAEAVAGTVFNRMQRIIASGPDPDVAAEMVPQLMHTVVLPYLGEAAALEELSIPVPRQTGTQV